MQPTDITSANPESPLRDLHEGPTRYYRLAPEYRRCGIYVFVGYLLVAGTAVALEQLGLGRGWDQLVPFALFVVPVLVLTVITFRWSLRVDAEGISRRRLFRWDLWPWHAFEGGQVRQCGGKSSFDCPAKPWWNRSLEFSFLQEDDGEFLLSLIKRVWIPPPLPPLPEELTIRWGFRRWAHLSAEGIRVGKGRHNAGIFYPWSALLQVRITRVDHSRHDFRELQLTLPEIETSADSTLNLGVTRLRLSAIVRESQETNPKF